MLWMCGSQISTNLVLWVRDIERLVGQQYTAHDTASILVVLEDSHDRPFDGVRIDRGNLCPESVFGGPCWAGLSTM